MLGTLFIVLLSLFLGGVITVIVQLYVFRKFFYVKENTSESKPVIFHQSQPFQLPEIILNMIKTNTTSQGNESDCSYLNVFLQFLYHELRDSERVRRWFRDKLTVEFEELLSRTTLGKILSDIRVRDIQLGSEFPIINSICIEDVKANEKFSHIECIDLKFDLSYSGGFQIILDVKMLLGKTAWVSIKVGKLSGHARLQFNRLPYSHWSFSFYDEPILDLQVESLFQGRSLPQVTNLISNQIRKAIRRKHTLPNFKIRYKPFFPIEGDNFASMSPVGGGKVDLTLLQLSRLMMDLQEGQVYCLLGISRLPWIDMFNYKGSYYVLLDVVVTKSHSKSFNAVLKQEYLSDKNQISVTVESPGDNVELLPGDVIIAVEGRRVNQPNNVAKFVRAARSIQVTLRIERKVPLDLKICENEAPSESVTKQSKDAGEVILNCDKSFNEIYQTRLITLDQIMVFDESLQLKMQTGDKYLNVTVRHRPFCDKNAVTSVAHINIPLTKFIQANDTLFSMKLKPMDPFAASNSKNHPLSAQNGFVPVLCYGDILFRVDLNELPKNNEESTENLSQSPCSSRPGSAEKKHIFVMKHLTASTQCQFCGKKIWFKDAEQCQDCQMICHKKCVIKCRLSNVCVPSLTGEVSGPEDSPQKVNSNVAGKTSTQPEIVMTTADPHDTSVAVGVVASPRKSLSSLLASMANSAGRGLKRVGSAQNLQNLQLLPTPSSELASGGDVLSKSLPPTPQQTPGPSRKASIPQDLNEEITNLLQTLMRHGPDHGEMLTFAKDTGKTLYDNLDLPKRKDKIQEIMDNLKMAIDAEAEIRIALERTENSFKDETSKAKSAFMIGKSDEKTQALTLLMLHLCAGLQHIQDLEEQQDSM